MANAVFQVKRTSTTTRTPNTTAGSIGSNSQWIAAGELALNMSDKILFTSDGTNLITVGQNTTTISVQNSTIVGFSANSSAIVLGNSSISANGTLGSAGYFLTSNGTASYWSSPGSVGTNVNATYAWTNTQTWFANLQVNSTSLAWVGNTTTSPTVTFANSGLIQSGNSTVTAAPQVVVANSLGTTTINTNAVSTTLLLANVTGSYANITGQVNAATLYAATSANVGTAFSVNSTVLVFTGSNVSATSANLSVLNATVAGNLTVSGTVTTLNSQQLTITDTLVELASNNSLATTDIIDSGWFNPANSAAVASPYYAGFARIAAKSSNTNPWFWLWGSNTNPNTASTIDQTSNSTTGTLQAYLAPYGNAASMAFVVNSTAMSFVANTTVSLTITANSVGGTLDGGSF